MLGTLGHKLAHKSNDFSPKQALTKNRDKQMRPGLKFL